MLPSLLTMIAGCTDGARAPADGHPLRPVPHLGDEAAPGQDCRVC